MKTFLATFIGIIVALIVMMLIQMLGHTLFPVPFEINPNEPDKMMEMVDKIPVLSLVSVIIAHALGQLSGLLTARAIDKQTFYPSILIIGFLMLGTIANLAMIPHPVWFVVADIAAMLLVAIPFIIKARK